MKTFREMIIESVLNESAENAKIKKEYESAKKELDNLKKEYNSLGSSDRDKLLKNRYEVVIHHAGKKIENYEKAVKNIDAGKSAATIKKHYKEAQGHDHNYKTNVTTLNNAKKISDDLAKALNGAKTQSDRNLARAIINSSDPVKKAKEFADRNHGGDDTNSFIQGLKSKSSNSKSSEDNKKSDKKETNSSGGDYTGTKEFTGSGFTKMIEKMKEDGWFFRRKGETTFGIAPGNSKKYAILSHNKIQFKE